MITFQEMIRKLADFWVKQGCVVHQGYDLEVGAGTFNPATFLRSLGPEPYKAFYIEPSRRPTDGRYGTNPTRLQHYFQCQVILKPSPPDIQDLCLKSLEAIGFNLAEHDMRFVHDDWESPTLGAWGLGWEVWMDGMEVTQFTYFQSVAGLPLKPITGEVTYGLERLCMHLQKVGSIYDMQYNDTLTYGDIYHRNEVEWSHYNFKNASTDMWKRHFEDYENEAKKMIGLNLPLPAYDFVLKASHAFNMLDARGVISVTERTGYIARVRDLACLVAKEYLQSRESQGYPLLKRFPKINSGSIKPPERMPDVLLHAKADQHQDFLLEIGSEELPATFVPIGCANLEKAMRQLLEKEGLPFKSLKTYGTPRRLAVYVEGLAMATATQSSEKRGPPLDSSYDSAGKLTATGEGFFRSIGKKGPTLAELKQGMEPDIAIRAIKGVDYLFATVVRESRSAAEILSEQLPSLILNLDFPKKMRWADLDITYARPLRWIVALFGEHAIPFIVGDILSGRESCGHRQLSPHPFALARAQSYLPQLKQHQVMADAKEREAHILEQLAEIENKVGGKVIARNQVLPQVLNLVEWPFLTYAEFDAAFLKAPKEVLISEMVEHQKDFPIAESNGNLKNLFVITANIPPTDAVRSGNQKALFPRLNDGVFLYEQGLASGLDHYNEKLKSITFQKELGSLYDKVQRLKTHAAILQRHLKISDPAKTARAASLCKADIASEMVYEFPELQGIIGRYYALAQGEDPEVAAAIDEHWMPRGENAPLPETPTGTLLSLADKIDNLLGCYSANLKPTSSSDPYALRRQTLGLIKILIRGKYHLPLQEVLKECLTAFPKAQKEPLLKEVEAFLTSRVKTVFQDYGFSKDEIEAGLSRGFNDIYDAYTRVEALHKFRTQGKFQPLYEVFKRAKGQIDSQVSANSFSRELLKENAERELDNSLTETQMQFAQAIASHDYDQAYELIAKLQPPLANLFDQVKILDDKPELRQNRLALLSRVFGLFGQLLDFNKIQI